MPEKEGGPEMSVEEIVMRIKAGETDLLPVLWERVEGFVQKKANAFLCGRKASFGMDFNDLCQEGFFAVLDAIKGYDIATCNCHFKSYLATIISRRYLSLVYASHRNGVKNPLDTAIGIDLPVNDDGDETIADTLTDGTDPADDVLHDAWLVALREALETALSNIKAEQAAALRRRWYGTGGTPMTPQERKLADRGLMSLRKPALYRMLKDFMD